MNRKMIMTSVLALGLASPAIAETINIATWDDNGDGIISQNEFESGFRSEGLFTKWDIDGNGELTHDELAGGTFGGYDIDANGRLDLSEVDKDRGVVFYNNEDPDLDYTAWDLNKDGEVDRAEFEAGVEQANAMGTYDLDGNGNLSEDEFNMAVFGTYDTDATGNIEEPERAGIERDRDFWFWDDRDV